MVHLHFHETAQFFTSPCSSSQAEERKKGTKHCTPHTAHGGDKLRASVAEPWTTVARPSSECHTKAAASRRGDGGFLRKPHRQVEVMQDESDLTLAHAASISLARTSQCRALLCEEELDKQQVWAPKLQNHRCTLVFR
jgi:hypothetical protein